MSEMSYKQLGRFFKILEHTNFCLVFHTIYRYISTRNVKNHKLSTRKIVCPTIGILEQTVYYNNQTFVMHHYLLPLIY